MCSVAEPDRDLPPEMQDRLAPALHRVVDSTQRRRRILALVQDALGQLRLDMKYLMFDLEATRRERDRAPRPIRERLTSLRLGLKNRGPRPADPGSQVAIELQTIRS